jgi:epoxyqueuosine reductase QueG
MQTTQLSYQELTKAPNLIYHAVMDYMSRLAAHNTGQEATAEELKTTIVREMNLVLSDAPALRKPLTVTIPKAHPTTPERRYVNLVWDNGEKVVVLATITCVEKGGKVQ